MSRLINLTDGMRFGVGIDSLTEQVRGTAIEWTRIGEARSGDQQGGQIVDSNLKLVESQESLMESMNLSVSASVRYGMASGDAKFSFSQEKAVNQYSLYLLLRAYVRNPPRHMVSARLLPEAKRVYNNDPEEFRQTYGDTFIDEVHSGGDFFGLFIFEAFDERCRTELRAELSASMGALFASGEIKAAFGSAVESAKSKSSMEIRCLMSGGAGLQNPGTMEDLKELYRQFNRSVLEHPIDYKASIKEFRYLPLPQGPTWAEQAVRGDVIEQCGKRIVEGIKLRSDIDFILRYPKQFKNPDRDALRARYAEVDAQLPRLAQRARDCASNIERCSLEGMAPVATELPERLLSTDPIDVKWQDIKANDSRAAGYFQPTDLQTPITTTDRGPRGGRFKIFVRQGVPIAGIFWHPEHGAFGVYGGIMQEYLRRGHCEGPLGYPKSDEAAVTGSGADGLDRISTFENGFLWWDQQTQRVSDTFLDPGIALRLLDPDVVAHLARQRAPNR